MGIKTNVSSRIGIPSAYTKPDAKIIRCALQACELVKKQKTKPTGFPAGCDMFVFANAGIDTSCWEAGIYMIIRRMGIMNLSFLKIWSKWWLSI
jgi:hypothetical protein